MIPEDSDSWLITALSDEIWCFQGWHLCRWGANDLPTAGISIRIIIFSGHRILVALQRYFCKGVPRLRYDSNCLWHLLAQSGSVFQISINLPLAVVLCSCSCNATGDLMIIGYHWLSSWGCVGQFGGLSDRKNNLINQNTKTQSSVSLTVFSSV